MASYPHMIFASESADLTKDRLVDIVTAALGGDDVESEQSALKAVVSRGGYPFTFWFEDADRVGEMYVDYLPEGARRRPVMNATTVVDMSGADDPDGARADDAAALVGALAATDGVYVFAEATKRFVGMSYGDEPAAPAPTPEPVPSPEPAASPEPVAAPEPVAVPTPDPIAPPEPVAAPEPVVIEPAGIDPVPAPVPAERTEPAVEPVPVQLPRVAERDDIGAAPVEADRSYEDIGAAPVEPTPAERAHDDIGAAPVTEPDGPLWAPPTREDVEHPVVREPAVTLPLPEEATAEAPAPGQAMPAERTHDDIGAAPAEPTPTQEPAAEQPAPAEPSPQPAPVEQPAAESHAVPQPAPVEEAQPATAPAPAQEQGQGQQEGGFFKRFFGRRR